MSLKHSQRCECVCVGGDPYAEGSMGTSGTWGGFQGRQNG